MATAFLGFNFSCFFPFDFSFPPSFRLPVSFGMVFRCLGGLLQMFLGYHPVDVVFFFLLWRTLGGLSDRWRRLFCFPLRRSATSMALAFFPLGLRSFSEGHVLPSPWWVFPMRSPSGDWAPFSFTGPRRPDRDKIDRQSPLLT